MPEIFASDKIDGEDHQRVKLLVVLTFVLELIQIRTIQRLELACMVY